MRTNRQTQLEIVRQALASYSGKKRPGAYYTMICCPFHEDSTPSGMVFHGESSYKPGNFKCYGCGAQHDWNTLADRMGWTTFSGQQPKDQFAAGLKDLSQPPVEVVRESTPFKTYDLPEGRSWRGFSTEFLSGLGIRLGRYESGRQFVYLPVDVLGRRRGYIRAAIRKGPGPSYLNKKGAWSKRDGLFLFDQSRRLMRELGTRTVVLVEGPRDALRLYREGIPAISILGTQTWTEHKAWRLEQAKVARVVLFFDGDPAGIKATDLVAPDIRDAVGAVEVYPLWKVRGSPYPEWARLDKEEQRERKHELWDPGNCPLPILKRLRNRYFGE